MWAAVGGEQSSQGVAGGDGTPAAHRPGGGAGVLGLLVFLQVLEVGQGLAVGELRLRVALAELVADAAHVAHHGHQEIHTCGKKMTRGQVTWPGCHGWDGSPGGWGQGWGLTVCGVGAVGL